MTRRDLLLVFAAVCFFSAGYLAGFYNGFAHQRPITNVTNMMLGTK